MKLICKMNVYEGRLVPEFKNEDGADIQNIDFFSDINSADLVFESPFTVLNTKINGDCEGEPYSRIKFSYKGILSNNLYKAFPDTASTCISELLMRINRVRKFVNDVDMALSYVKEIETP